MTQSVTDKLAINFSDIIGNQVPTKAGRGGTTTPERTRQTLQAKKSKLPHSKRKNRGTITQDEMAQKSRIQLEQKHTF